MNAKTVTKLEQTVTAAGKKYVCEFRWQRHGGYLVTCSKFLPLRAYGDTLEEAHAKAREGIEAWVEYAECREFV